MRFVRPTAQRGAGLPCGSPRNWAYAPKTCDAGDFFGAPTQSQGHGEPPAPGVVVGPLPVVGAFALDVGRDAPILAAGVGPPGALLQALLAVTPHVDRPPPCTIQNRAVSGGR